MRQHLITLSLSLCACAVALGGGPSDKYTRPGQATYSNDNVEMAATAILDPDTIHQVLGMELAKGYCLVKVTVTPKGDDKLRVDIDDFTLLSYHDGQRSQPFQPSQIAGNATMVVSTRQVDGGRMASENNGPIWGGMGGGIGQRMPGSGGGIGNTASQTEASASIERDNKKPKSPLMIALEKNILTPGEISQPITGYLYFPLEGKQRSRELALLYKGQAGRFTMEFHDDEQALKTKGKR